MAASSPVRHARSTRLWHWLSALSVFVMLMSGMGISNAHPRLYWGEYGANADHAWMLLPRFPGWLTIPGHYSLSDSREWHLGFAWVFAWWLAAYLIWIVVRAPLRLKYHISLRDISPRSLVADLIGHVRLRFHPGSAAKPYAPLQKLIYVAMIFGVFPLLIATGLALSPAMDAAWPWLTQVWGGRQSARSVHFILATLTALFIIVHLLMVLASGPVDQIRAMITGRKPGDTP